MGFTVSVTQTLKAQRVAADRNSGAAPATRAGSDQSLRDHLSGDHAAVVWCMTWSPSSGSAVHTRQLGFCGPPQTSDRPHMACYDWRTRAEDHVVPAEAHSKSVCNRLISRRSLSGNRLTPKLALAH